MEKHFIFGYGSLINFESRQRTGRTGNAIPALVNGVKREWNLHYPPNSMSGVGALEDLDAHCNGVIVEVTEQELEKFDERELKADYERREILASDIRPAYDDDIPNGKYWVYISMNPQEPNIDFPIPQSYLDVILTGCLGFGRDFANEFIKDTGKWSKHWIDDRDNPRYERYMKDVEFLEEIDELLLELLPNEFKSRKRI